MTKPTNYATLDLETLGLPGGVPGYQENLLVSQDELLSKFWPDIREFSTTKGLQDGTYETFSRTLVVDPNENIAQAPKTRVGVKVVNSSQYGRIPMRTFEGQRIDREELIKFLDQRTKGKHSRAELESFVDNEGKRLLDKSGQKVVEYSINNRAYRQSEYAAKQMIKMGEHAPLGVTTDLQKEIQKINTLGFINLRHQRVDQVTGISELASTFKNWIDIAESTKQPFYIGGLNVGFDINVTRAKFKKLGGEYQQLLDRFDAAVQSGQIVPDDIVIRYKKMLHKLFLADKRYVDKRGVFSKEFAIRNTPDAVIESGLSRIGRRVTNEQEFINSTVPGKGQAILDALGKTSKLKKLIPEGVEPHIGAYDDPFEHITSDMLFDFERRVAAGASPKKAFADATEGAVNLEEMLDNIADESSNAIKYMKRTTPKNPIKTARGFGLKSKAKVGLALAAIIATYGFTRSETKDSLDDRVRRKLDAILNFFRSDSDSVKIKKKANKNTGMVKTAVMGTLIPAAGLWALGFIEKTEQPDLFGVRSKPQTIKEFAVDILRTIQYGAKKAESTQPLMKVFRMSSAMDYFLGSRNLGEVRPGLVKAVNITTIKDGKLRGRFDHIHGKVRNMGYGYENFLQAAKLTENPEYALLKEVLEPSEKTVKAFQKLITRISTDEKGRAVVFLDVLRNTKEPISGIQQRILEIAEAKRGITVEASIQFNKLRTKDIFRRHEKGVVTSAIQFLRTQKSLYDQGHVKAVTFDEYIKNIPRPKNIQMLPIDDLVQLAKLTLQIGPKGLGESRNELYKGMRELLQQTHGEVVVRNLTGKWKWTLRNAEFVKNFMGPFIHEMTVGGMNHFLERPFYYLEADPHALYNVAQKWKASENFFAVTAGKALSFITGTHLGLPAYAIKGGIAGYLKEFALKRVLPAAALFEGVRAVDHVLGNITGQPRGPIISAPIRAWQGLQLLYSGASDLLGLTSYAKKQEQYAPGSTGFGIFSLGASLAATFQIAKTLSKYAPKEAKTAFTNLLNSPSLSPYTQSIKNALTPYSRVTNLKGIAKQSFGSKAINELLTNPKKSLFMLGLLPMIPFLPGFLGAKKSLEERRAEYSGRKEVPIRESRGWVMSSSPLQGGRTIQYRKNALNLIMSDWENRGVIWPSYYKRLAHNATLGLYGRYMLEEYHKQDQPVYQSAAYGANIPLIGPLVSMSGLGGIIKPTVQYHDFNERELGTFGAISDQFTNRAFSVEGAFSAQAKMNQYIDSDHVAHSIGLVSENSTSRLYNRFARNLRDFIGFRGFFEESAIAQITGQSSPDEFIPYAQSGTEFYNPAQQMWQYEAGDISVIGGELLRRIFVYPEKNWDINTIPNELYGTSWLPEGESDTGKKSARDITHGTTFDKIPMGWLYGSRKGWEFQFPTMKGVDLEDYPDPIRVEILKHVAPYSGEFKQASYNALRQAIQNNLDPDREQRLYESLSQAQDMREQLYSSQAEYSYALNMQTIKGRVSSMQDDGRFTLEGSDRVYSLAGVSTNEEDIRAKLLRQKRYETTQELSDDMNDIIENTKGIINSNLRVGADIQIQIPNAEHLGDRTHVTEAIIGGLNQKLIERGASFKDTGPLGNYNVRQQLSGLPSKLLSKYWNKVAGGESFWAHKLVSKQDYLSSYKYSNVFNREVKLWQHPIEQILKPMIASTFHKFGVDSIPQFTVERRRNQEYWDAIKYIKYRMLEKKTGNPVYRDLWKATMLGSNPFEDDMSTVIQALPQNERQYFDKFVSEPDPEKRAEIMKYIPRAARRIYSSIWEKRQHESTVTKDDEEQEYYNMMQETEGFGMTEKEEREYDSETQGQMSKADWKRLKYIEELAKSNPLPGPDDQIYNEDVNLENVELLSLRDQGENVQDYGFFEDKIRVAAFDARAQQIALQLNSKAFNSPNVAGSFAPYLGGDDDNTNRQPTASINPIMNVSMKSNGYVRLQERSFKRYVLELADDVVMLALRR